MMLNDIVNLSEDELYEFLKSLSNEEQIRIMEDISNNLDDADTLFICKLNKVLSRIEEDIKFREEFYFELYNLTDNENKSTVLGEFYKLLYTHHYIKAVKMYLSFSDSMREKNKVLYKNKKAYEYLQHFKSNIKKK